MNIPTNDQPGASEQPLENFGTPIQSVDPSSFPFGAHIQKESDGVPRTLWSDYLHAAVSIGQSLQTHINPEAQKPGIVTLKTSPITALFQKIEGDSFVITAVTESGSIYRLRPVGPKEGNGRRVTKTSSHFRNAIFVTLIATGIGMGGKMIQEIYAMNQVRVASAAAKLKLERMNQLPAGNQERENLRDEINELIEKENEAVRRYNSTNIFGPDLKESTPLWKPKSIEPPNEFEVPNLGTELMIDDPTPGDQVAMPGEIMVMPESVKKTLSAKELKKYEELEHGYHHFTDEDMEFMREKRITPSLFQIALMKFRAEGHTLEPFTDTFIQHAREFAEFCEAHHYPMIAEEIQRTIRLAESVLE